MLLFVDGVVGPVLLVTRGKLRTPDGEPVDVEQHNAECPGRAFGISTHSEVKAVFACADWKKHGHSDPLAEQQARTAAEREQQQAEKKASEPGVSEVAKKNKAEAAAGEVREEFIKKVALGRLSDAAVAITQRIQMEMPFWYAHAIGSSNSEVIARYLGVPGPKPGMRNTGFFTAVAARLRKARRAYNTAFAQVAMAFEDSMRHKKTWHRPTEDMVAWLQFLAAEGYTLSAIEKEMVAAFTKKQKEEAAAARKRAGEGAKRAKTEAKARPAEADESASEVETEQQEPEQVVDGTAGDETAQPEPEEATGSAVEDEAAGVEVDGQVESVER